MLATRYLEVEGSDTYVVEGQVRWTDPAWEGAGLTLESAVVTYYAPLPDVDGGREVVGYLRTNQHPDQFPFVLHAVAAEPGALGTATAAIWVGDAIDADPRVVGTFDPAVAPSGFGYAASGTFTAGDPATAERGREDQRPCTLDTGDPGRLRSGSVRCPATALAFGSGRCLGSGCQSW